MRCHIAASEEETRFCSSYDEDFWSNIFVDLVEFLALYWLARGLINELLSWCQKAVKLCQTIDDRWGEGIHWGHLGIAYRQLGLTNKAIDCFKKALAIVRDTDDSNSEGRWLSELGEA